MAKIRQRFLSTVALLLAGPMVAAGPRFYPDDPIAHTPPPVRVEKAKPRKLNDIYDFFYNTFAKPGQKSTLEHPIPARAINTLGEVPDSAWWTDRHRTRRMTIDEMVRGPGDRNGPADGRLIVTGAKTEGITPGLTLTDSRGHSYLVKFDPKSNPEMASGADVVGSKFFYALGYNTPENHVLYFRRDQLTLSPKATIKDAEGKERPMQARDVEDVLSRVRPGPDGRYRALASFYIRGDLLGPFRYHGTRRDDPNDFIPHEDRRDLRGLYVFASWLNHTDAKSLNSLDSLVEEGGASFIKHYLIDFGAILGSDSFEAKSPRAGNVNLFAWKPSAEQLFSGGLYVPRWMRANYPHIPAVGHFEYETFEPEDWKPNYYNPAFENRLPDDEFWAAKQVMAFTDEEIRALVKTGDYSDPRAVDWITKCLIERRNKIGRAYFEKVLPLDRFRIEEGRLAFDDLATKYRFAANHGYVVSWSRYNNTNQTKTPFGGRGPYNCRARLSGRRKVTISRPISTRATRRRR